MFLGIYLLPLNFVSSDFESSICNIVSIISIFNISNLVHQCVCPCEVTSAYYCSSEISWSVSSRGIPCIWKSDLHGIPTSINRIYDILAHRQYDVTSGWMTLCRHWDINPSKSVHKWLKYELMACCLMRMTSHYSLLPLGPRVGCFRCATDLQRNLESR